MSKGEDFKTPKQGEIYLYKGKTNYPYVVLDVTGEADRFLLVHALDRELPSEIDYSELGNMFGNVNNQFKTIANRVAKKIGWQSEECKTCGIDHMTIDEKFLKNVKP